ncbi:MBL fold metallo-hydrolase [Ammoniphilus sp. 3BR4]|uniref:MBL fold metallo-hydrolase n=1 Tax=Ammoniphilus sp. 3BR4 TaxID=3158265 RepID=UPI00346662C2
MDNFKVIMLGTGAPRPNILRSQSAHVLFLNELKVLVDCGDGTTQQLMKSGIEPEEIKHVWFTHLHSDHVMGYASFLLGGWASGRRELTIVGPEGTRDFHKKTIDLYKEDIDYRVSIGISPAGLLDNVNIIEVKDTGRIECDIPATVTTTPVIHNVPTFAYRFDFNGHSIVFSGDTIPSPKLVELARGADVLIQDACLVFPKGREGDPEFKKVYENLKKEHCSPAQAAIIAKEAEVKKLVMTHFMRGTDIQNVIQDASKHFDGEVIAASDLQTIEIIQE